MDAISLLFVWSFDSHDAMPDSYTVSILWLWLTAIKAGVYFLTLSYWQDKRFCLELYVCAQTKHITSDDTLPTPHAYRLLSDDYAELLFDIL